MVIGEAGWGGPGWMLSVRRRQEDAGGRVAAAAAAAQAQQPRGGLGMDDDAELEEGEAYGDDTAFVDPDVALSYIVSRSRLAPTPAMPRLCPCFRAPDRCFARSVRFRLMRFRFSAIIACFVAPIIIDSELSGLFRFLSCFIRPEEYYFTTTSNCLAGSRRNCFG